MATENENFIESPSLLIHSEKTEKPDEKKDTKKDRTSQHRPTIKGQDKPQKTSEKPHKKIKTYEDTLSKALEDTLSKALEEEHSFKLPLSLISFDPPEIKKTELHTGAEKTPSKSYFSMCCSKKANKKNGGHEDDNVKKETQQKNDGKKGKAGLSKNKNVEEKNNLNILDILKETKTKYSSHTVLPKSSHKIKILEVVNLSFENFCAIITVGDDQSITIWNNIGDEIKKLTGDHTDEINSLAVIPRFSEKNKLVFFSSSNDHDIRKWEIIFECIKEENVDVYVFSDYKSEIFGSHFQEVKIIRLFPDYDRLVSASNDRTIKVWNIATRKEICLFAHESPIYLLTVSSKEKIFSVANDKKLKMWDIDNLDEEKCVSTISAPDYYVSMSLNKCEDTLYLCTKKGRIFYWVIEDPEQQKEVNIFMDTHHEVSIFKIFDHFIPFEKKKEDNNEYFLTGSEKGEIRLWAIFQPIFDDIDENKTKNPKGIKKGKEIGRMQVHSERITSLVLNDHYHAELSHISNDKYQEIRVYSASEDKTVKRWNLTALMSANKDHTKCVTSISLSFNGQKIISGGMDGKILISDVESKFKTPEVTTLDHGNPIIFASEIFNEKFVLAIESQAIRIWDLDRNSDEKINFDPESGSNEKDSHSRTDNEECFTIHKLPDFGEISSPTKSPSKLTKIDKSKDHKKQDKSQELNNYRVNCAFLVQDEKNPKEKEIYLGFTNGDVKRVLLKYQPNASKRIDRKTEIVKPNNESTIKSLIVDQRKDMYYIENSSNSIKTFNLETNKLLSLSGHKDSIEAIILGYEDHQIISASKDKTINIWNTLTKAKQTLKIHTLPLISIAISNDKKIVASCDEETILVWMSDTYEIISKIQSNSGFLKTLAISPIKNNRVWVFSGSADGRLRSWPIDNGKVFWSKEPVHCSFIRCVRITPDSKHVITGSKDGTLKIWNISTKTHVNTVKVSSKMVFYVEILKEEEKMVKMVALADEQIMIYDIRDLNNIKEPKVYAYKEHTPRTLALNHDGRYLFSGGQDNRIIMWDLKNMSDQKSFETNDGSRIEELIGKIKGLIIAGESSGKIRVWDINNNKQPLYEKSVEKSKVPLTSLTITNDGAFLIAGYMDNKIRIWSNDNKSEPLKVIDTRQEIDLATAPIKTLVFAAKTKSLFCGTMDGDIFVYNFDLSNFKQIQTIKNSRKLDKSEGTQLLNDDERCKTHWDEIHCMDISEDEQYLVSGGKDKRTIVWKLENQNLVFLFKKEGESNHSITCFCLSKVDIKDNDEKYLVLGGNDKKIRVWVKNTKNNSYSFDRSWDAHEDVITCLSIDKIEENDYIFSGSWDKTICLWSFKGEKRGKIEAKISISGFTTIIGPYQNKPMFKIIFVGDDPRINVWVNFDNKDQENPKNKKKIVYLSEDEKYIQKFQEDSEFENWKAHSKSVKFVCLTTPQTKTETLKLVTGGNDNILRVWDVKERILLRSFNNIPLNVPPVFLTGNGRLCLLNNSIFDLYHGKFLSTFKHSLNPKQPIQLKYSNGKLLALESDGDIKNYNFGVLHHLKTFFLEDNFLNISMKNEVYMKNYCLQKKNSLSPLFFTDLHYLLTDHQNRAKIGDSIMENPNVDLGSFLKEDVLGMNCIDLIDKNKNQLSEILNSIFKIMDRDSTDFYNKMLFFQYALITDGHRKKNDDINNEKNKGKDQNKDNSTPTPPIYDVLNKLMSLFGEDTFLINKFLEHSLVKVSHELYDESLEMAELEKPIFEIIDNIFHINKEKIEKIVKDKYGEASTTAKRSYVRVKVLLLPYITDTTQQPIRNFYKSIIECDATNSIFANNILKLVTDYKWERFLVYAFFADGFLFTLFFVWFYLNYIYFFPYKLTTRGVMNSYAKLSIFADCMSFVYCIIFFIRTGLRIAAKKNIGSFFSSSLWNVADVLLFFLLITIGVIDIVITCTDSFSVEWFKVIVSFTMLIYWLRFMSLLRGLQQSAFMVRLIIRVFYDIKYFLLVLGLFIVGFSFSGYMLQSNFVDNVVYDHFGNPQFVETTRENSLTLFYRLTLGDFTLVDAFKPDYLEAFWLLIVYSTVLLSIVLLNLLISILNDTYDKVMSSEILMRNYELMHIIYEIEEKIYILPWVRQIVKHDFTKHRIVKWLHNNLFGKNKKHLGKYLVYIYNDVHQIANERDSNYERIRSIVEREEFQIKLMKQQIETINKNFTEKSNALDEKLERRFEEIQNELKLFEKNINQEK